MIIWNENSNMISKLEGERPKIQVLNCKSTYSMIGLWWSIHHSAASINLGPILNYNLLLEFLDDIKMCGINRQYQAHCVTIAAKQYAPSGAWRIISWVKILMSRLSRLLLLFWGKKASFCWVNRLSRIYHWTPLILLSNLKFLCFSLRNLSFETDYY